MNALNPDFDPRHQARTLYWQGFKVCRISEILGVPEATISSWKKRDGWDDAKPIDRVDATLEARMTQLIMKDEKDGRDFKEIDLLGRQLERIARINKYSKPEGHEGDLNPKVANRNSGSRKKPERNAMSEEQIALIHDSFLESMFDYQKH